MDKKYIILGGILLLLPIIMGNNESEVDPDSVSYLDKPGYPSGMRKNNPGNIRPGSAAWQGQINTSGGFVVFRSWIWGIRAMIKLLINYMENGVGSNPCSNKPQRTIKDILETWAPRFSCGGDNSDEAVNNYIKYVSDRTGFAPTQALTANKSTLRALVKAMSHVEQGRECVTDTEFNTAFNLL